MQESREKLNEFFKGVLKSKVKKWGTVIFAVIAIIVLLAAALYFITIDDGTYKEGDWSSTNYGASQYINNVSVNSDGTLSSSMSAQELWDKLKENGCRVDEYLDTPEELARLMKAEIVTQYPDTRKNPDEDINWEDIVSNEDTLQGIIKLKRADTENNKKTMIYTDPTTFQSYIDEYNQTGSETAKKNALEHFTLKKVISSTPAESNNSSNNSKTANDTKTTTGQKETVTNVNGDGYSEEYTSSAGITYKHYKQFQGSYANNTYWEGTIHSDGCGPSSIAILASGLTNLNYTPGDVAANMSYTSYETLQKEMESLGMTSEVIQSPSAETIQDNLRNGKVMLVSVNSNTIFTGNSHIMALVDINSSGQVYICNPGSSSLYGWYDISEIMKGCKYIVVTDAGATGIANSTSSTSEYTAVVATWRQVDTTVTTNDPEVQAYSTTEYSMTTTDINYREMVDKYTMPFDLIWAFLVTGEEKEFVFDIADLVYNSDIQITIHDNLTVNTDTEDWNYTQRTKAVVDFKIKGTCEDESNTRAAINHIHDPYEENEYNTVKTTVTKTNTINTALTRANVWIVDYKNDYTYVNEPNSAGSNSSTITIKTSDYSSEPNSTGTSFSCEHIDEIKEKIKETVEEAVIRKYQNDGLPVPSLLVTTYPVEEYNVKYFTKYVDVSETITNQVSMTKYTEGVPELKEKTDKDAKEPNFSTIYNKAEHIQTRKNISSVASWLFEIIETNDSTADMLDMIKYLLYKATGKNYGVTEFDFSEYDPKNFSKINSAAFGSDILLDFLKSWENPTVWKYQKGEIGYNGSVTKYITQDKTKYICFDDGLHTRNFGFGVCHYYSGHFNNQDVYASVGVDITQYFNIGSMLDVDIVDQVKMLIIKNNRDYVNSKLSAAGISLEEHQLQALDAICYQWGPYGTIQDFITAYQKYGDTEALRQNFTHNGDKPFLSGDNGRAYEIKRANANWTLFHEGRYLTSDGGELDPNNYVSANVGKIASVPLEQRLSYVFPNGTPKSPSEMSKYLTTVTVPINNSAGVPTTIQITCNQVVADELVEIFKKMQAVGFKITDAYSYSWRQAASGTGNISHHSYGLAVDINAAANPAVYWGYKPDPNSPYYINKQIVDIWKAHGFYWGGDWSTNYYDPMHFSYTNH